MQLCGDLMPKNHLYIQVANDEKFYIGVHDLPAEFYSALFGLVIGGVIGILIG